MSTQQSIVSSSNLTEIISALIIKIAKDIQTNSDTLKNTIDTEISNNLEISKDYTNTSISKVELEIQNEHDLLQTEIDSKTSAVLSDAKSYTDSLIKAGITSFVFVTTLPTDDINPKNIYFVPKSNPESENVYEEYVYINSNWEKIGDTTIDLSNYYNIQQVDDKFAAFDSSVDLKISNYDKIVSAEINDVKVDTSLLMDKATYLSKDYPDYVNKSYLSIKIEGVEDSTSFSYYGKDIDGNIGFHIFPINTRDDLNNFQSTILNATASTEYYINLTNERNLYDVICQGYKYTNGNQNISEAIKTFNTDESYNQIYDTKNIVFNSGLQINKNFPLTLTTNSDGLFESELINKSDYVSIGEIL